ncbi:MAG TPA: amino acid ABC transporter substrate-binding protein [Usitatibacter sp.]|nr:amino acid ABC transporter substrate-binding protein [Usitatibacter sp.]
MLRKTMVLAAGLACALIAAPVLAQEGTLAKVKSQGFITIANRDASIPFSYYDANQKPVGYAMDLCMKVVDAVKKQLKMPKLEVKYQLVTSANRIPLIANGTADLECGSTTNNLERQQQVDFSDTYFVTGNRWISKKSSHINSLQDLKGKTVVSTAGTSNLKEITEVNNKDNLGMNIISANGHPEAFQMVETGRAVAFVMDDILLYSLQASSRNPKEFVISKQQLSLQPYGMMMRKNDPEFKKLVDDTIAHVYKSGEINKIYAKWFEKPIPPKGIDLKVPMSAELKKVIAHPTDSGDPKAYE